MSDNYAYEWLTTLFEPETSHNGDKRRLLLLDEYGSVKGPAKRFFTL
jgi:hypothetical protein